MHVALHGRCTCGQTRYRDPALDGVLLQDFLVDDVSCPIGEDLQPVLAQQVVDAVRDLLQRDVRRLLLDGGLGQALRDVGRAWLAFLGNSSDAAMLHDARQVRELTSGWSWQSLRMMSSTALPFSAIVACPGRCQDGSYAQCMGIQLGRFIRSTLAG